MNKYENIENALMFMYGLVNFDNRWTPIFKLTDDVIWILKTLFPKRTENIDRFKNGLVFGMSKYYFEGEKEMLSGTDEKEKRVNDYNRIKIINIFEEEKMRGLWRVSYAIDNLIGKITKPKRVKYGDKWRTDTRENIADEFMIDIPDDRRRRDNLFSGLAVEDIDYEGSDYINGGYRFGFNYVIINRLTGLTQEEEKQVWRKEIPIRNCLVSSLIDELSRKKKKIPKKLRELEKRFAVEGVREENIKEIAETMNRSIVVKNIFGEFIQHHNISMKKPIYFMNTRINHVDMLNKNIVKLDKITLPKTFHFYKRDKQGRITQLLTSEAKYILHTKFNDIANNIKTYPIADEDHTNFTLNGNHICSPILFPNSKKYKHGTILGDKVRKYDMIKAYYNYYKSPYYKGMLTVPWCFMKTNKYHGPGIYNISFTCKNKYLKTMGYKSGIYCYPEVLMLKKYEKIKIEEALLFQTEEFRFNEEMLEIPEGYKIEAYKLFTGMCMMYDTHHKYYFNCEYKDLPILKTHKILSDDNNEHFVYIKKRKQSCRAQFSATITSCQRTTLITQLMEIPYENVLKIDLDAIYTDKICKLKGFKEKRGVYKTNPKACVIAKKYFNMYDFGYKRPHKTDIKFKNVRGFGIVSMINAKAGCGKTFKALSDKTLIDFVYVGHSKILIREKCKNTTGTTIGKLTNYMGCTSYGYRRVKGKIIKYITPTGFIFDEVNFWTRKNWLLFRKSHPNTPVLFLGDFYEKIPCQLTIDLPMDMKKVPELNITTQYRMDKDLDELTTKIREGTYLPTVDDLKNMFMKIDINKYDPSKYDIICMTQKMRDDINRRLKHHAKYRYLTQTGKYLNGDIVLEKPKIKQFVGKSQKKQWELCHAFTAHSYEGRTIPIGHNLIIDFREIYKFSEQYRNMIYTILTRCKKINQIFLL